ncbi:MAG: HlyD family efflux transporter periplasmic adaptor subunit [Rhodocyclales bacterium GT-UBC]|nr:MAG: HlyD family efflux transporter periplasmic adaptor subunit [Rhodocyclales bacterium GT-UBC]
MTTENTLPATGEPESRRKRQLVLLGIVCLLAALAYGLYWMFVVRFKVDTDNAYVQGNVVQITPQIGGTIVAIEADDTDNVKLGQMLVRLDPADARVALDQAEAQLAETVREVRVTFANNNALAAAIDSRQADLTRAQAELARLTADLARREPLVDGGAVSREEVQHLQTAIANARSAQAAATAGLAEAREQLAKNQSLTEGTTPETHPRVQAAAGKYREAWLASKRLGIAAPVAGTVARRSAQVGQRVASGVPLMAIVPLDQLWVDANFKESQLETLRIGQPATLTADIYGHRTEFKGTVAGLGAGTGAAFSLLPAQNATGNWIKVVQRVPVRIQLDPQELAAHPLRVGLSMEVSVDVHDQSGKAVTEATRSAPVASTTVFDDLDKAADARVNAIVSANLGHPVNLKRAG